MGFKAKELRGRTPEPPSPRGGGGYPRSATWTKPKYPGRILRNTPAFVMERTAKGITREVLGEYKNWCNKGNGDNTMDFSRWYEEIFLQHKIDSIQEKDSYMKQDITKTNIAGFEDVPLKIKEAANKIYGEYKHDIPLEKDDLHSILPTMFRNDDFITLISPKYPKNSEEKLKNEVAEVLAVHTLELLPQPTESSQAIQPLLVPFEEVEKLPAIPAIMLPGGVCSSMPSAPRSGMSPGAASAAASSPMSDVSDKVAVSETAVLNPASDSDDSWGDPDSKDMRLQIPDRIMWPGPKDN